MIFYRFKSFATVIVIIASIIATSPILAGDIVLTLEEPTDNITYSGVANIRGWVVGSVGIERVELYVDGVFETDIPSGGLRLDVSDMFPNYPDSSKSGFSMAFNYSHLTAGQHTVLIQAIDKSGVSKDASAAFNIARFDSSFISDPTKVSLNGATISHDNQSIITINNLTADGKTYDIRLDWRTAMQGYAITRIAPTGNPTPATDFSGTYQYSISLLINTCPVQVENNIFDTLTLAQNGTQLTGTDTHTLSPLSGTIDAQGNFSFTSKTQLDNHPCKLELNNRTTGNLISETIFVATLSVTTAIETSSDCPKSIECTVQYQGTIKKK